MAAASRGAADVAWLQRADDDEVLRWLAAREAELPAAARQIPFALLWWPAATAAADELAAAHPAAFEQVAPGAVRGVQVALLVRLGALTVATLHEAMAADLTVGQRFLYRLQDPPAEPPRVVFARFCARMAAGGLPELLAEFAVLPGLVDTVLRQWRACVVEVFTRVGRHRRQISEVFGIEVGSPLTAVAMSAGDQHQDGRSVAVLEFGDATLVYKPRDIRLESLWSQAVQLVCGDEVRTPATLHGDDGERYGFVEFVAYAPAADAGQLRDFYRNAGRTLAVLHALSATDCHHENLIAVGDQLLMIDAEALFETRSTRPRSGEDGVDPSTGTVLDVGLLPTWLWLAGQREAIDISGLGVTPASVRLRAPQGWRCINTDAMGLGPIAVEPPHPTSLPTPAGQQPEVAVYVEELVEGFGEGYREVLRAREESLALLEQARGLRRRVIQRPTYVYASLLRQLCQPSALRSVAAQRQVLEQLEQAYGGAADDTWPLCLAEQEALARLDVPLFEADLAGSATRWLGGELAGWPGVDAVADVAARLRAMGEDDLRWQQRLIRSAIAAREYDGGGSGAAAATSDAGPEGGAASSSAVARRVTRQVLDDGLRTGTQLTWMTLGLLPDGDHANVQRIGAGLYDGVLGVVCFLHQRGEHEAARAALAPLFAEWSSGDPARVRRHLVTVGVGFTGAGGHLRGLRWLQRNGHLAAAEADRCAAALIGALAPVTLAEDRWLDVINGVAGVIPPLAAEWSTAGAHRGHIEELLEAAADRLVDRQRSDGGWDTLPARAPLTGYAHGAAGIAVALVAAHRVLADDRYLDAALRGLDYEAGTFDAAAGNWPDYRVSAGGGFMLGWCAGAPGIALSRGTLLPVLADHPAAATWRRELEVAARTTAEAPLQPRDHLCCGNLGRAVILRTIGRQFGRADWLTAGTRLAEAVAARAADGVPRSFLGANPPGVLAVPGLMTGLAGAGLALRQSDPTDWVEALLC